MENLLGQGLRFASNLILTHLLFPECFGLMALVSVFIQGLEMISDVGIGMSVVQDKRGTDPKFLNTAWSIQVLRGILVYFAALGLTWPVTQFYGKPELLYLLPVAALGVVVSGANSINFHLLSRRVALGRIAILNIGSQILTIAITIVLAWAMRSVWSLVIGSLMGYVIKCALSFVMCPGPPNRFAWDAEIARSLIRFGKWILVSSLLGFLVSRFDSLQLRRVHDLGGVRGVHHRRESRPGGCRRAEQSGEPRLVSDLSQLARKGDGTSPEEDVPRAGGAYPAQRAGVLFSRRLRAAGD